MVDDVLFVVYTERRERILLISAKVANALERSIYYDQNSFFIPGYIHRRSAKSMR
jgi:hypothetical protein